MKRCVVINEKDGNATVRVFPKAQPVNGEFARAISAALAGVKVEELHSEEGRLDEVFRSITMPDTAKEGSK